MLSILIPIFNADCSTLVSKLADQASAIEGLEWEIVVADDGSTDQNAIRENQNINAIPHCRYILKEENVGRAMNRNYLARQAKGDLLLFIDGDGDVIMRNYLAKFHEASRHAAVCYGGYRMMPGPKNNLRHLYEVQSAPQHSLEERQKHPYRSFNIANLLIKKEIFMAHPLDERFRKYGYEDVLLGKQLRAAGISVSHIDAPIGFFEYESNESYVAKTEEGLQTLYQFQDELQGYSKIIEVTKKMHRLSRGAFMMIYRLMEHRWRKNLTSDNPSLKIFQLYKLGYFLSLSTHAKDLSD